MEGEVKRVFKVTVEFPGWCNVPRSTVEYLYSADSLRSVLDEVKASLKGDIKGIVEIGPVREIEDTLPAPPASKESL